MAFRLTAVILLLVVSFYNAQADKPACNIMLSGSGTYLTMKPYGNKTWKALGNDGTYLNKTLEPGSNGNFHLHDDDKEDVIHFKPHTWDDASKCLKDDSVAYNSTTNMIFPKLYVNPVKILMTPPFAGSLMEASKLPKEVGTTVHFSPCLRTALDAVNSDGSKATGVQWEYKSEKCYVLFDSNLNHLAIDNDDTVYRHTRSMIFKPLPLMGTTLERISVGSKANNLEECAEKAKKESDVVAFVNLSKEGDCYYAKDTYGIAPSDESEYWMHKVVDYKATPENLGNAGKKMSCTFN